MKQGTTFGELVEHVDREAARRRDYYVPTSEMQLMTDASDSRLATPCGQFQMKAAAHLHLAELCGIDRRYYQKMRVEAPFLLDRNVNHWLSTNPPKQRMVRTLGSAVAAQATGSQAAAPQTTAPQVRAIVSSRYAVLDNDALLRTVEPIIAEQGLTIESCDVSEERLTIKMTSPRLIGDVKVGDAVQAGVIVRNSEVRCSAVEVDWFVKRLICLNGMVVTGPKGRGAFRRHVGRDWDALRRKSLTARLRGIGTPGADLPGADARGAAALCSGPIPENMAREQWERAIWDQLQASLRQSLNAEGFSALLERLVQTTALQTSREPDKVVERIGSAFHLHPHEQSAMLHHLIHDEDFGRGAVSLWAILNAVTRTANSENSNGKSPRPAAVTPSAPAPASPPDPLLQAMQPVTAFLTEALRQLHGLHLSRDYKQRLREAVEVMKERIAQIEQAAK